MKKYLIYGHGGAYNHGAEAIVKTTVKLIKKKYPESYIQLVTHFVEQDLEYDMPVDEYYESDKNYLKSKDYSNVYKNALQSIDENTICLSIGGDNYCYDNWEKWDCFLQRAKAVGAQNVLWSCSIDPYRITERMLKSLALFDTITTRERETYNILKKNKLKNVNILDCADVAFLLEKSSVAILRENREYIALNVSPLILRTSNNVDMLMKNIELLIQSICENSEFDIMLLSHVMMPTDNDYEVHSHIYNNSQYKERMILVPPNLNVKEYKYLISQCRVGVFSRTHAAIAAYSSYVPCVTLGYSIKAKGIAEDFEMERFLIDNGKIEREDEVWTRLLEVLQDEQKLRIKLKEKIPNIQKKALKNLDVI